jgi:hypothetical protein
MFGESPKAAKNAKQLFLMGNGKLTNHCELGDPHTTIYQDKFMGKQKNSKEDLGLDWKTSVFIGSVSPDPLTIRKNMIQY